MWLERSIQAVGQGRIIERLGQERECAELHYLCARCQMTTPRLISSDAVGYGSDE